MNLLSFLGRGLARYLARPGRHPPPLSTSHPGLLAATLRRGDVLLVEGSSHFSTAIKYLTQSTWSHAALYLGEQTDPRSGRRSERMLVDVDVVEGVRLVSLQAFAGLHTRICRPQGLSDAEIEGVADFMLARLGYSYDLKNVFDLARYLIRQPPVPQKMKRRMIALGSGEPTKAICSTLLAQAFGSIRYPILPEVEWINMAAKGAHHARQEILHIRDYSLYTPRDFDVSPFFAIVKPRLQAPFDFHALTWEDDGDGRVLSPRALRPASEGTNGNGP